MHRISLLVPQLTTDNFDHIIVRTYTNGCGLILLNRPARLHALSAEMVLQLCTILDYWEHVQSVRFVVFASTSSNFCAGGDLKEIISSNNAPVLFFRANYTLNYVLLMVVCMESVENCNIFQANNFFSVRSGNGRRSWCIVSLQISNCNGDNPMGHA